MSGEENGRSGGLSADLEDAVARGDLAYLIEALAAQEVETRVRAAEALGEVGGNKAGLVLLKLARDRWGERPEVRIAALRALGSVQPPGRYADTLEGFIASDNRKVVRAARSMLESLDPEDYPARLAARGCLDHNAIRTYGERREGSALPLLVGFFDERAAERDATGATNWGRVYAGARALGNIGGKEAVRALESLAGSLSGEIDGLVGLKRERARKILGAIESSIAAAAEG